MRNRTKSILIIFSLILFACCSGQSAESQDWCKPKISVEQNGANWQIKGQKHTVELNASDFGMKILAGNINWQLTGAGDNDLVVKSGADIYTLSLTQAGRKNFEVYSTGFKSGVKIQLSEFKHNAKAIDLKLDLYVCLEGRSEDLICEIAADEKNVSVKECLWPGGFESETFDHTVVPFMQGMLLPREWPRKVWLYDSMSYGRGLYMPWWGHQKDDSAAVAILETSVDAGCRFSHPAGGPTKIQPRWVNSLGKLGYPRRLRMCFFEKGNYVDMCKRYREHVIQNGQFVLLKEKIARSELVSRLIGSPVIHTNILVHIQPESHYYKKDDEVYNHHFIRFDERAKHLQKLFDMGVKKAYVHLDGWGWRGYDNLHPDILPPSPEAGGWEGLRTLAETCDKLNYLFALHDQYRDYYLDAESYDPRHTILREDGNRPYESIWYGGKQSILCSSLAPGYVKRNYKMLQSKDIKVRGAYLDVFAVVPPDECYNPEHPVTRQQCLEYRGDCFDFIRTKVGVVSSEEPADWAVKHLDIVHHGPFALDPNPGKGPAMGIAVPLFSLVYHDALFLPWSLGKGGWGVPDNDFGYLYGLANAGLPYLSLNPDEKHLQQVRTMCVLNERLALTEMTKHEFLDEDFRKQCTTFADGTKVTIDLDRDTFTIVPELDLSSTNSFDFSKKKP